MSLIQDSIHDLISSGFVDVGAVGGDFSLRVTVFVFFVLLVFCTVAALEAAIASLVVFTKVKLGVLSVFNPNETGFPIFATYCTLFFEFLIDFSTPLL